MLKASQSFLICKNLLVVYTAVKYDLAIYVIGLSGGG